ncbi:hypothetical protein [Sanguibacter sp. HDW7]|uniref:hypothetical protein n=1 Tax=Sanguibacter sp. HDW7 TaxID=2714931 RepID=UPI00140944FF|nr:hypothetical protein [Sanguibacter sp. HDW7]QIK83016.1 hypothetical protein G7063_04775 [Sanguibacter sp. HDW7]
MTRHDMAIALDVERHDAALEAANRKVTVRVTFDVLAGERGHVLDVEMTHEDATCLDDLDQFDAQHLAEQIGTHALDVVPGAVDVDVHVAETRIAGWVRVKGATGDIVALASLVIAWAGADR